MTDLRKVSGPSSRLDRHAGRIVAVIVTAVLLAILKPWGSGIGPTALAPPVASPTASPTAAPSAGPYLFDFLAFGTNEPPPGWEIWPAGNLASFQFAMRVDLTATASTGPGAHLVRHADPDRRGPSRARTAVPSRPPGRRSASRSGATST